MTLDQALVFVVFATGKRLVTDKQVRKLFALVNLEKNQEIVSSSTTTASSTFCHLFFWTR